MLYFIFFVILLSMIEALEALTQVDLQAMPRRGLENLAWQEKEIISLLKEQLAEASLSNLSLQNRAASLEELLERFKKTLFGKSSEKSDSSASKEPTSKSRGGSSGAPKRKLPSERYPNVEVIEKEVEVLETPAVAALPCRAF